LVVVFGVLCFSTVSSAQEPTKWFELKDFGPVTKRLVVTVENPADVPVEAALVHVALKELQRALPDAKDRQLCVIDPATKPARRDAADQNFVPFQVSNDTLIFALPLKPREAKQLVIYTAPQPLNLPGFAPKTAYDDRHAYRSFENNLIAYRMETGPGANTTGMGIDAFGKTAKGRGLRLVEAYEAGHDSYHKLSYWGIDILKVGYGPAIGGVYVIAGDQLGRPQFQSTLVRCVYSGPVETVVRMTAPVEVNGRRVTVDRLLTLVGDDRTLRDEVRVIGDNIDGLQLGIGIRDLPNNSWSEKPDAGYAMCAGDANQPGYKSVAIGALFDKSGFSRVIPIEDAKNKPGYGDGGHVYVLNAKSENGAIVARNRLTMIWDGDGDISTAGDFEKALQRWAAQRDIPIKVNVAGRAESQP
jgi:hypothetical protein